ncbi:dynamin family protein [Metabacillus sp. GX 13764]|uniref:dynamin family protein n=1 Tax=Metabacillus kandeliae TaxID=2900151 RepID=UPI001E63BC56|nr:dynamin family protein [Metabacillus kandeliae]MCD7034580.1 dynamin family protein [Metabacillus kandeliae]
MDWKLQMNCGIDQWFHMLPNHKNYISIKNQLTKLKEDIYEQPSIMIVGEFNAGKSTFINALLGEKVLSSDVTLKLSDKTLTFLSKYFSSFIKKTLLFFRVSQIFSFF